MLFIKVDLTAILIELMRITCLIILFQVFTPILVHGQIDVILSEKHRSNINAQSTASQKLSLYRKYFTKDSIKAIKKSERYWQAKTDSLSNAVVQREKALSKKEKGIKDGISSRIYRRVYKPWAKKQAKAQLEWFDQQRIRISATARNILLMYFEDYFLQATQNDSLLTALKTQMPSLQVPTQLASKIRDYQLINPGKTEDMRQLVRKKIDATRAISKTGEAQEKVREYGSLVTQYDQYGKILQDTDSLKSFASASGEKMVMSHLSKTEQYSQLGELKKFDGEVDKLKAMPGQHRSQAEQLQDSAYIKSQAKKKAEEMAMKYIADHPEIMRGVQKKMSLLMKKYAVVPNSNDLSTAIKRNSLRDKSLRERIYFAANFQFISFDPINIDLAPMAGYRFNRNFILGLGINYRQSFGDSIPAFAPDVFGYKVFSSYDIMKSFFIYGEFDRNAAGVQKKEASSHLAWKNAAFLGLGRKVRIHPKIEMTMTFLYNFLYDHPDPVYPKRWNVRVGIQTSALAMFKSKPTFN